jgi:SWIRM domain/SWIRM-associated region 1
MSSKSKSDATSTSNTGSMSTVPDASKQDTEEKEVHHPATLLRTTDSHPLLRDAALGMNPISIQTGFYGPRGERIRHFVQEGALRLPQSALDNMMQQKPMQQAVQGDLQQQQQQQQQQQDEKQDEKQYEYKYKLPDLDGMPRPSLDNDINPFLVTKIHTEDIRHDTVSAVDGSIQTTTSTKTILQHCTVVRPPSVTVLVPVINDMERIRGGGGDGGDGDVEDTGGEEKEKLPIIQPPTTMASVVQVSSILPASSVEVKPQQQQQQQQHMMETEHKPTLPIIDSVPTPMDVEMDSSNNSAHSSSLPTMTTNVVATTSTTANILVPKPIVAPAVQKVVVPVQVPVLASPPASNTSTTTTATTTADPPPAKLEPQQIANMEQALRSTIQNNNIGTSSVVPLPTKFTVATTNAPPVLVNTKQLQQQGPLTTTHLSLTPAVKLLSTTTSGSLLANSHPLNATIKPVTVGSSSNTAAALIPPAAENVQVYPLNKRPLEHYESHSIQPPPSSSSKSQKEKKIRTTKHHYPEWYQSDRVSDLERAVLSEWFDASATHRNESSYLETREKIIDMSETVGPNHYITGTLVRRTIPGDAGSLLRLHAFLTSYTFINENAINESTPTPMILLHNHNKKAKRMNDWSTNTVMQTNLMNAVVEQSRRSNVTIQTETPESDNDMIIDWDAVAKSVGYGTTATECERHFLTMSIPNHGSVTPDVLMIPSSGTVDIAPSDNVHVGRRNTLNKQREEIISDIVNSVDPTVLRAVTHAALSSSSNDIPQAQKAAVLGLLVHGAVEDVHEKEDRIVPILSEIMDLRMKRIELRLSALDDVEDMLEAERVTLELERRDLYTARCRHWFGGT